MGIIKRIIWKDRIVQRKNTYRVTNNDDGTQTFASAPGTVTQEGTPVSAANLNAMDEAIQHVAFAMDYELTAQQARERMVSLTLAKMAFSRKIVRLNNGITIPSLGYIKLFDTADVGLTAYDYVVALNLRGFGVITNPHAFTLMKNTAGSSVFLCGTPGTNIKSFNVELFYCKLAQDEGYIEITT